MGASELSDAELAEMSEALATRLADLLDDGPMPADPAELERLAVIATAPIRDTGTAGALDEAFVTALEQRREQDAATLLAAASALVPRIREAADLALAGLSARGVAPALPPGFGELGAIDASRGNLGGDTELLRLSMRRPGEERRQVASVLVEAHGELAGALLRAMISPPLEPAEARELLSHEADPEELPEMDEIPLEQAERILREGAALMRERGLPATGELALSLPILGLAVCRDAGALAEVPLTPPGFELFVDPEDEEGFERLQDGILAEFGNWVGHGDAGEAPARSGELVAGAMLHWKWGYADGRLGHWTLADLEELFLDHAPRKLPSDEEFVADAPRCAAALLLFLDEVDLLGGDPLDELLEFCEQLAGEYAEAAADPGNWGPAKALVLQMGAEGIDPSDREAIDRWMREFNERPRAERDRVLGPAIDRQVGSALTGDPEAPPPWEIGGAIEPDSAGGMRLAVGWFPPADYAEALERWDELGELWAEIPHVEYCRRMEATLRGWSGRGVRPSLVAVCLDEFLAWCEERGEDPEEARPGYAADMLRLGEAAPWPPGRNDPCWCGSERKYKRCCGSVSTSAMHPLDAGLNQAA